MHLLLPEHVRPLLRLAQVPAVPVLLRPHQVGVQQPVPRLPHGVWHGERPVPEGRGTGAELTLAGLRATPARRLRRRHPGRTSRCGSRRQLHCRDQRQRQRSPRQQRQRASRVAQPEAPSQVASGQLAGTHAQQPGRAAVQAPAPPLSVATSGPAWGRRGGSGRSSGCCSELRCCCSGS